MKKLTLILLVVLMLAAAPVVRLLRLEVINKSNSVAYVTLKEVSYDVQPVQYWLTIEPGVSLPGVELFTLVRGLYDAEVLACGAEKPIQYANWNLNKARERLVILPCDLQDAKDGDGVLKVNQWLYPFEDEFGVPIIYDLGGVFSYRY